MWPKISLGLVKKMFDYFWVKKQTQFANIDVFDLQTLIQIFQKRA